MCDEAEGAVPLPEDAFDENGEIDEAHIFCSICRSGESTDVRNRVTDQNEQASTRDL